MRKPDPSPSGKSWDTYWHGTGDVGAFSSGGVDHPAIRAFWSEFFATLTGLSTPPRMIDVATGNGAVVEVALTTSNITSSNITCVDISEAAIENVGRRFPGVSGIVADALAVPLEDYVFDLATSQFGVEYAGTAAIHEAGRLLAPGGRLAMLIHIEGGTIFKECDENFKAIRRLCEARFVPCAAELFRTGFAAVRGGDRGAYDAAGRRLQTAVTEAEAIMAEYGEQVAGETIARLYDDVGRIHSELQQHDPEEVLAWLDKLNGELPAYAERMTSMTDAALNQDTFDQVCDELAGNGFSIQRAEPLMPQGQNISLAWVLIAEKQRGL